MTWWMLAGLVLGIIGGEMIGSTLLGLGFLALGLLFLYLFKSRQPLALFLVFLAAGMLLTGFRLERLYSPQYGGEGVYTLRSEKLLHAGDDYQAWQGRVLAPKELAGAVILIYSDRFSPGIYTLEGRLTPPVQYGNPGQGWHCKRKLYAGEVGVLSRPRVLSFQERSLTLLERARQGYQKNLAANIDGGEGTALALALTTGDRSLLGQELKSSVYLTGVGHLLALSGLHVGILLALLLSLLRRLGLSSVVSSLLAFVGVLVFACFAGPSPSLVRAVLMSAWGIGALLLGREREGLQGLAWTALFMLLYNPLWLFDYAFVFSFLATFICLRGAGRLEKYLSFLPEPARRTASITLLVQLVALPLTIYLFGSASLWAPLANLVIVPLMPALAGFSLLAGLLPGGIGLVVLPAKYLLLGTAEFLRLLGRLPLSVSIGGLELALVFVASGGILLYLAGLSFRKAVLSLGTGLLLTLAIFTFMANQVVTVWFLDVGQGDSILIRNRGGWTLVDCGDLRAGERALVPTLRFLGVHKLRALILTHPHDDHIGGLDSLLENVAVARIYSNFPAGGGETQVLSRAEAGPDLLIWAHNLDLTNLNDTSLLVSLGDKVLLTGDIEAAGEKVYLPRIEPHRVLKVAHHGSSTSSSPLFLAAVRPEVAVISCGLGNRFGLPNQETLDNLEAAGAAVFRTDFFGCVRVDFWPWGAMSVTTFWGG